MDEKHMEEQHSVYMQVLRKYSDLAAENAKVTAALRRVYEDRHLVTLGESSLDKTNVKLNNARAEALQVRRNLLQTAITFHSAVPGHDIDAAVISDLRDICKARGELETIKASAKEALAQSQASAEKIVEMRRQLTLSDSVLESRVTDLVTAVDRMEEFAKRTGLLPKDHN